MLRADDQVEGDRDLVSEGQLIGQILAAGIRRDGLHCQHAHRGLRGGVGKPGAIIDRPDRPEFGAVGFGKRSRLGSRIGNRAFACLQPQGILL